MLKLITAAHVRLQQAQDHLARHGEDAGNAVDTAVIVAGSVVVAGLVVAGVTAFVKNTMGGLGS